MDAILSADPGTILTKEETVWFTKDADMSSTPLTLFVCTTAKRREATQLSHPTAADTAASE
eukprot:5871864-Amphidinium_carterae.1